MRKHVIAAAILFTSGLTTATAEDPAPVAGNQRYACLVGESIPADGPRTFGINAARIDWWLREAANGQFRKLEVGREPVRPVCRTVILNRASQRLTLLGPDGRELHLSLEEGPLAAAGISGPGQRTTFSFSPDARNVAFANKKGNICVISLPSRRLTITTIEGVNRSQGVVFSPDGMRIAYSKTESGDGSTRHAVYVASSDYSQEKKLTEYRHGSKLGFDFLQDSRLVVTGPDMIQVLDPISGKLQTLSGPWERPIRFRTFGGISPDGSAFIYDTGGPYMLNLHAFDVARKQSSVVKRNYLESFQPMIWVRLPNPGTPDGS